MGCGASSGTSSRLIQDVRRATQPRRPSQVEAAERAAGGRRSADNSHSSQRSSLSSVQRKGSPPSTDPTGQAPLVLSPLQSADPAEAFSIVGSPTTNQDAQAREPSSGTGSGSTGRRRSSHSIKTTGDAVGLQLPSLPPSSVAPAALEPLYPFPIFEPADHQCPGEAPNEIRQRSWALVVPRSRILAPDMSTSGSPYHLRGAEDSGGIVRGFTFPPINDSTTSLTAVAVAVESPKMERSAVFGGTFSSLGEQTAASRAFEANSASLHVHPHDAPSPPALPPLPVPTGGDTQLLFHPPSRSAFSAVDAAPNIATFGTVSLRNRTSRPYVEPVRIPSPPAPSRPTAENPLSNPRRRLSDPLSESSNDGSGRISVGYAAAEPASALYWQQCLAFQPKSFWQRHEADNHRREAALKLRNDAYVPPRELQGKVQHWLAEIHEVVGSS